MKTNFKQKTEEQVMTEALSDNVYTYVGKVLLGIIVFQLSSVRILVWDKVRDKVSSLVVRLLARGTDQLQYENKF